MMTRVAEALTHPVVVEVAVPHPVEVVDMVDHQVVDGAPAAEFLQTVKGLLEDPWWMVI